MSKYITGDFSSYTLMRPEGLAWGGNISDSITFHKHLVSIDILTEENKHSILGKAGWGAVGAVVLGPIGLLAGVLAGGHSKQVCVAGEFDDGRKFIATVSPAEHRDLIKIAFENKKYINSFSTQAMNFCAQCGTPRPLGANFCHQCGNRY